MKDSWYKASNELTHDDTLRLVSLRAKVPHGNVISVWVVLLERCSKGSNDNPGIDKFFYDAVSFLLGYEASQVKSIIESLEYYELIQDGKVSNWESHQVKTGAVRVRECRQRKQNVTDVTKCNTMKQNVTDVTDVTQCNVTSVTCVSQERRKEEERKEKLTKEKKEEEKKREEKKKEKNNYVITKEKENFELPVAINREDWMEFEQMRKKIKKPMTLRAKKMLLNKLLAINQEYGHDPNEVLQQSILHCYDVVYPLKRPNNYEHTNRNYLRKQSSSEIIERGLREIDFREKIDIF